MVKLLRQRVRRLKKKRTMNEKNVTRIALTLFIIVLVVGCSNYSTTATLIDETANQYRSEWQEDFNLSERKLEPTGKNRFFILEPGYQIILEGRHDRVTITVLDETIEIAGITARVVEEKEWKNGELIEVSRNFFAIDDESQDVFYFGEDVDDYKAGIIINHGGAWRAGEDNAEPGMIMPGQPVIGQKHYQEIAPGIAMDRAEIVSLNETLETPAGVFTDSLQTRETTPLNPSEVSYKLYAPGIGMIQDSYLLLSQYGFVND